MEAPGVKAHLARSTLRRVVAEDPVGAVRPTTGRPSPYAAYGSITSTDAQTDVVREVAVAVVGILALDEFYNLRLKHVHCVHGAYVKRRRRSSGR